MKKKYGAHSHVRATARVRTHIIHSRGQRYVVPLIIPRVFTVKEVGWSCFVNTQLVDAIKVSINYNSTSNQFAILKKKVYRYKFKMYKRVKLV